MRLKKDKALEKCLGRSSFLLAVKLQVDISLRKRLNFDIKFLRGIYNKHLIKITLSIPHQTMIETKPWQHKKISSTPQYETLVSRDFKNSVSLNQSAVLLPHHVVLITRSF